MPRRGASDEEITNTLNEYIDHVLNGGEYPFADASSIRRWKDRVLKSGPGRFPGIDRTKLEKVYHLTRPQTMEEKGEAVNEWIKSETSYKRFLADYNQRESVTRKIDEYQLSRNVHEVEKYPAAYGVDPEALKAARAAQRDHIYWSRGQGAASAALGKATPVVAGPSEPRSPTDAESNDYADQAARGLFPELSYGAMQWEPGAPPPQLPDLPDLTDAELNDLNNQIIRGLFLEPGYDHHTQPGAMPWQPSAPQSPPITGNAADLLYRPHDQTGYSGGFTGTSQTADYAQHGQTGYGQSFAGTPYSVSYTQYGPTAFSQSFDPSGAAGHAHGGYPGQESGSGAPQPPPRTTGPGTGGKGRGR
ncbi:hypothetical protein O7599_23325 [Streptomyces sp. WMMC500]|uniref:hypothetical protein n=1 Tax=Streptomyces sp. WMMC500 TaxID=3015154 RepID=UPI00248C3EDE|nr:hypothetical protein [Streptomyces sp. WMMC500]WBB58553.1 hypothetical protein O7599_23325 [Streptomyces sp. WMMC500]